MKDIIYKSIKTNKYDIIIKFSIICVILCVIYLLYNRMTKINENFETTTT
jgi:hypothetical protein